MSSCTPSPQQLPASLQKSQEKTCSTKRSKVACMAGGLQNHHQLAMWHKREAELKTNQEIEGAA